MNLLPPIVMNGLMPRVREGYEVGTRYYHTLRHAVAVYGHLENLHQIVGLGMPHEVGAAALYHDIIYIPGSAANEDESALALVHDIDDLALHRLVDTDRTSYLIWLTKFHFRPGLRESTSRAITTRSSCSTATSPVSERSGRPSWSRTRRSRRSSLLKIPSAGASSRVGSRS
jgi:hypothetical protein